MSSLSVSIVPYDDSFDYNAEAFGGYKHLELGAANGDAYLQGSKEQHQLLCDVAKYILARNPESSRFTFFLNDISSKGLDLAASNLKEYLLEQKRVGMIIEIRIVKIAADMLKKQNWPAVDTAFLLNPNKDIGLHHILSDKGQKEDQVQLVETMTKTAKLGFYIQDIHLSAYIEVLRFREASSEIIAESTLLFHTIHQAPENLTNKLSKYGVVCRTHLIDSLAYYRFPTGLFSKETPVGFLFAKEKS